MPPRQIRSARLASEPSSTQPPLIPTVVVASYKGGVWKTGLAVPLAERLAWGGLRVLMITADSQEDARSRLGVRSSDPMVASKAFGVGGGVTVLGLRGSKAVDLLYRRGPESASLGSFDIAVVDTPPEIQGGSLPGVLLIATIDGGDAARNLVRMLERTPANTDIILVSVGRGEDPDEWAQNVAAIEVAVGRSMQHLDNPLPRSKRIAAAHDEGRSLWTLPRRGRVLEFLGGVESLAHESWSRVPTRGEWRAAPQPPTASIFVSGWDDEA